MHYLDVIVAAEILAETDLHYDRLTDVVAMLKHRYGRRSDVYVGANMLVYDELGNVHRHLSPDAFVAELLPVRPARRVPVSAVAGAEAGRARRESANSRPDCASRAGIGEPASGGP